MKIWTLLLVVTTATATQFAQAQDLAAIRAACTGDAQKFCAGVQPGGGRIMACLKEHKDSLSDGCKQAAGLAASAANSSTPTAPSDPVPATPAKPAPAPKAAPAKSAPAKPTSAKADSAAAGEKFTERVITDPDHNGMRVATIHLPEKWHFESKVEWHYGWIEYPLIVSYHSENPDNAEAFFQYPLQRLESGRSAAVPAIHQEPN